MLFEELRLAAADAGVFLMSINRDVATSNRLILIVSGGDRPQTTQALARGARKKH